MNNALKSWQGYFKLCFLLILLVPVTAGVSATPAPLSDTPNVSISSQGSNYVAFTWPPVTRALYYEVHYVKNGNPSAVFNVSGTSISFSSLSTGTYDFYFRTVFDDKVSDYVIEEDLIML